MTRNTLKYIIILLALTYLTQYAHPRNATEDYQTLSYLSSSELMKRGRDFFTKREAGEALSCFLIVAERYSGDSSKEEKETCIRALNNAGCVYKYLFYDYPRAYEYFYKANDLSEADGLENLRPLIMVNMGDLLSDYAVIYNSETLAQQARSLFDECFEKSVENRDWELMTTAFHNLSNENFDLDLKRYDAIFSDKIPADTPDLKYVRLLYRGIEQIQKGNYSGARRYFEQQFPAINTNWEAVRDSISTLVNIAKTYKMEGDFRKATEFLEKAQEISDRSDLTDTSADISRQLSEAFLTEGDSASYFLHRNRYLEKRDELHRARLANIGEMKYISDLQKEERMIKEAATRHRIFLYLTWSLVIIVITVAASAFFIWRQNRILKSRNQSLFDKYQQMLETDRAAADQAKDPDKYSSSSLDDSRRRDLQNKIREIMEDPDIISCPDFTLKQLADNVGSNTTYVSQTINETYGVSFSTLLGNFRVRLVCQRITNEDRYSNLTVEGIANSVGFKSRTAFLNAFKREVGLTPSEYLRMAKTENKRKP